MQACSKPCHLYPEIEQYYHNAGRAHVEHSDRVPMERGRIDRVDLLGKDCRCNNKVHE
jgi:hypothetical protein